MMARYQSLTKGLVALAPLTVVDATDADDPAAIAIGLDTPAPAKREPG